MEVSMEVVENKWRLPRISMEVDESFHGVDGSRQNGSSWKHLEVVGVSMGVVEASTVGGDGNFHCFHQGKFPGPFSVEASMSFHEFS